LPNEDLANSVVRELLEETGRTLTVDDSTLMTIACVRATLHGDKFQRVYVYSASVLVPYMTASLRTPTKVEHTVSSQSTIHHDGTSVIIMGTVDI
jgi:8-oxo-dGTP pyrophosphatase MutT (NUDIX family)